MNFDRARLFIDASNIRAGGGLTHLIEILRHATPEVFGIEEVIVAAPDATLRQLEVRPWLVKSHHPRLNKTYFHRLAWQLLDLPKLVKEVKALLFIPGAGKPLFKWPYVTMCRNLLPLDYRELFRFGFSLTTLRLLLLRAIHLHAYRHARGVIFLTGYCHDILPNCFHNEQMHYAVIPHGVNHELFKALTGHRNTGEPFRLLYISIINTYKHQDKVASAVLRLRDKGLNIKLTLIGPGYGPSLTRLKKIIGVRTEAVDYKGIVPYTTIAQEYRQHDAFILASTCETFCMILTEAMAMGMPIACSSRSSLPETLGDAGIYFDPENEVSLDSAILQLMESDVFRLELSKKALARAESFNWTRCAEDTFSFIQQMQKVEP